jgi:hypothetical protein
MFEFEECLPLLGTDNGDNTYAGRPRSAPSWALFEPNLMVCSRPSPSYRRREAVNAALRARCGHWPRSTCLISCRGSNRTCHRFVSPVRARPPIAPVVNAAVRTSSGKNLCLRLDKHPHSRVRIYGPSSHDEAARRDDTRSHLILDDGRGLLFADTPRAIRAPGD